MAETINYKINAWLTTKGSFVDQMKGGARAADDFATRWSSAGASYQAVGQQIAGSTGQMISAMARTGAVGLGGALVGGLVKATHAGVSFNRSMEDAGLTVGTMFQAFNMGASDVDVLAGKTSQFSANLERAAAMQGEIYEIAQKSPATYSQINREYQMMASGLSGVTTDLVRQRNILEKSAVLAGIVEGNYDMLGADIGRIAQGMAGMDVRTFAALQGPFGEAMAEVTQKQVPADLAAAFNKLAPEDRLKTLETVLSRIPPEVGEAYGKSFGGLVSTTASGLEQIAGRFTQPLFNSIKTALARFTGEGGILGGDTLETLMTMADFFGRRVEGAFARATSWLERAVGFITDNWEMLYDKARRSAVIVATAIKVAMVGGVTRMLAGSIVSGIGVAMRGASAVSQIGGSLKRFVGDQTKAAHMGIARGMKRQQSGTNRHGALGTLVRGLRGARTDWRGPRQAMVAAVKSSFGRIGKGPGLLELIGRGAGRVAGRGSDRKGALGGFFRMVDKGVLKIATTGTMLVALVGPALILGTVLGGLAVAFGGVAAYITENWQRISSTLIEGLEAGKISLTPLMTSLYTFWMRLVLVGEALIGGGDATSTFNGFLDMAIGIIDTGSTALGWFIQGLSLMVGALAAVKLGISAFMGVVAWALEQLSKLPKVGSGLADTAKSIRASQAEWFRGAQDTMTKSEKLSRTADKIIGARLSAADKAKAESKAKGLEKRLGDFLKGEGKAAKGRGAKVKVDKVNVTVNLEEPDPDRVMTMLVRPLEKMAGGRTQAYGAMEEGN